MGDTEDRAAAQARMAEAAQAAALEALSRMDTIGPASRSAVSEDRMTAEGMPDAEPGSYIHNLGVEGIGFAKEQRAEAKYRREQDQLNRERRARIDRGRAAYPNEEERRAYRRQDIRSDNRERTQASDALEDLL